MLRSLASSILVAAWLFAPSSAAAAEDCPTWFPDFRCEREGLWKGFHMPVVAPYLFESPFITTGLHAHGIWHDYPKNSVFDGGHLYALAVQARVAITDRLAFVATKDGYVWNRPGLALLDDTQGHMNIAAGLKYALWVDEERQIIVTPALRFEFPVGSNDTFQGHSDGLVIPSVSGAWGVGDWRLMGSFGSQIPFDGGQQSTSLFYQLYAGYDLHPRFVPFLQLSGMTWVHSGDGKIPVRLKSGGTLELNTVQNVLGTGRFEGADVINLGSRGVAGQDLFTWAIGAHVPLTKRITFTAAFERPFSHQKGIFQNRFMSTFNLEL